MKVLLLFAFVFLAACAAPSKIYLVRHAEKSTEPPDNPHLTPAGQQRAQDLAAYLKNKKIKRIYSTETNRTRETAMPVSKETGKPIQIYKNDTLKAMLLRIIEGDDNTLIVGHSNTLLPMLDALQIKHQIKEIADNDYDNIFVVRVKRKSLTGYSFKLSEDVYGELSPKAGDSTVPNTMHK